jgi:hypothetical protein
VALIPKTDGTRRPIEVFVSLYRLLSRARSHIITEWSMKASPHEMNMATRRHILDASYRLHMKKAIQRMPKPE